MNPEQHKHYLNNGVFEATFSPVRTDDLHCELIFLSGLKVECYRNFEILPINGGEFGGDYRFFIDHEENCGYIPERELINLEIIDKHVEEKTRWESCYWYRMMYTDSNAVKELFGSKFFINNIKIKEVSFDNPFYAYREYTKDEIGFKVDLHAYLCNMAQATKVEYKYYTDKEWQIIEELGERKYV